MGDIHALVMAGMSIREKILVTLPSGSEVEFTFRPLADYEKSILQSRALAGMNLNVDIMKLDVDTDLQKQFMKGFGEKMDGDQLGKITMNTAEAAFQIVAWCVVDEKGKSIFTLDEVKTWSGDVVPKIAERIRQISGQGEDDQRELEAFHKDDSGDEALEPA